MRCLARSRATFLLLPAFALALSSACADDDPAAVTSSSSGTSAGGSSGSSEGGAGGEDAGPAGPTGSTSSTSSTSADTSSASGSGGQGGEGPTGEVHLQLGEDLPPAVAERVLAHVQAASPVPVVVVPADQMPAPRLAGSVILAIGDTEARRALIADDDVAAIPAEGYTLRSGEVAGARALVTDGPSAGDGSFGAGDIGAAYGAYALLEHVGFAFLQPLAPTVPEALDMSFADVDRTTSPRWPVRGLQLHTMHPLELTDVLNGWGISSPEDRAGWESMLPDWDEFLEWSIANGQNRAHWVLLWAQPWGEFGDSDERHDRLTTLVERAHQFAIGVGIDTPLAQQQQHTFRLIRETGTEEEEQQQIRDRTDWLMAAGFDYVVTSMGSTEFTATDDVRTVGWMDELTTHLADEHGKEAIVTIHTSSGQTVANYTDPETGAPLNFNHLPHYADPRLGIMPHTVQHYGLDDPAPTYGNTDFEYVREFLQEQVGRRKVYWHPETAYWVSFDIDVPLFLPVYAHRRLHDLRLLAGDEDAGRMGRGEHAGERMDGQLTFSSGWEWGYWLHEVVTARGAWSPLLEEPSDEAALRRALDPVVKPFGTAAEPMRDFLARLAAAQLALLIEGRVNGQEPDEIERRNGQAYLQGSETWDDLSNIAESIPDQHITMTQPERVGLVEMRNPFHDPPGYSAEVEPLLAEMASTFGSFANEIELLRPQIPENALPLFEDIAVGTRLLALRAEQVHGLYDYVDAIYEDDQEAWREMRLTEARDALDQAVPLVLAQEAHYRVPADRIAGWRDNPTAYEFTYLWTARTLFYWWRDEGLAVEAPLSPCYLNIINPVTLAMGEGTLSSATDTLNEVFENTGGIGSATECAAAPSSEPVMPPEGLRP
jgi:hypothetical protein